MSSLSKYLYNLSLWVMFIMFGSWDIMEEASYGLDMNLFVITSSFSGGRRAFREFLRGEYSEENILFWLACEDLKKENNPEKIEEKARMIYEDYVSILSPREVSCDVA